METPTTPEQKSDASDSWCGSLFTYSYPAYQNTWAAKCCGATIFDGDPAHDESVKLTLTRQVERNINGCFQCMLTSPLLCFCNAAATVLCFSLEKAAQCPGECRETFCDDSSCELPSGDYDIQRIENSQDNTAADQTRRAFLYLLTVCGKGGLVTCRALLDGLAFITCHCDDMSCSEGDEYGDVCQCPDYPTAGQVNYDFSPASPTGITTDTDESAFSAGTRQHSCCSATKVNIMAGCHKGASALQQVVDHLVAKPLSWLFGGATCQCVRQTDPEEVGCCECCVPESRKVGVRGSLIN